MTDKDIIKALECCSSPKANCEDCPCFNKDCISTTPYVLDLINRQQAEIERLQQETKNTNDLRLEIFENKSVWERLARAEAIKEFAERLKNLNRFSNQPDRYYIDCLVKEMAGEDK